MKYLLFTALAASLLLGACTKEPLDNLSQEESRIYITNYNTDANFASYKTFSISDSVRVIDNNNASTNLTTTDQLFISAVRANLQQRGYVEVSKNSNPDIGVNVSRIYNTSTGVVSYNDYWNYYGGYWDPYYWGYGGYGYYVPYSYAVYQITEGALSIDMLDLKDADNTNQIQLLWTGMIRGSGIFNGTNAESQINALFQQSPYIKTN
jgi:hypothetical protein